MKQSQHSFSASYSSSNVRLDPTAHSGSDRHGHDANYSSIASRYGIRREDSASKADRDRDRDRDHNEERERSRFDKSNAGTGSKDRDSVIFAIDPKQPQCPIVFRDERSKSASRERLNLDNRNLSKCPILRGEDNLRLLNYENNVISKIDNLGNLGNLIFLDLYNNRISKIENLHCVPMLRVLMLGRNQIAKIENLENLHCLDVLDLHSNQIAKIENLSHLVELRVLNLAGNDISSIEHIGNLKKLVELNLRRNQIYKTESFVAHQKLQRILLSNNHFRDIKAIAPLTAAKSIQQLTVDNNPFYEKFHNKTRQKSNIYSNILNVKLVAMFPALRQLNNYEISEAVKKQLAQTHPELANQHRNGARSSSSSAGASAVSTTATTTTITTTTTTTASKSASNSLAPVTPTLSRSEASESIHSVLVSAEQRDADRLLAQNSDLKENLLNVDNVQNTEKSVSPESAYVSESMDSMISSSVVDHLPIQQKLHFLKINILFDASSNVLFQGFADFGRDHLQNRESMAPEQRHKLKGHRIDIGRTGTTESGAAEAL